MKLRFERQAQQAIKLTWGHGRYLDPWSIVHLLTGLLLGIVGLWLGLSLWSTVIITVALTSLYEGFEMLLGIVEDWQNSLLDVLIAAIGVWAAYTLLNTAEFSTQFITFMAVGILALTLLYAGWRYYLRHRMQ
ncbi:MAG: hypothetical protein G01um101456_180 [Parcubacteria group bacterium Gr01-1014_56]|nr:MAG: hypothetical protein G01um101456_180 [Parcubacteria group bacterium Gr01-1014_56]